MTSSLSSSSSISDPAAVKNYVPITQTPKLKKREDLVSGDLKVKKTVTIIGEEVSSNHSREALSEEGSEREPVS